jgi:hypothetical protein
MHVLEGHSYEEIARELAATPPMVRQLLHRARTRLRDSLGLLLPFPLLRAKVGVSLFAAAAIAGGTGVTIQNRIEHHPRSGANADSAQATQPPAASPAQKPVRDYVTKPASQIGGESSHGEIADRSEGPVSQDDDTATERDQHQSGDEEDGDGHGRSGDRDEEGTQARLPSNEDGEHRDSGDRSGPDSGDPSGDGSGGESGTSGSGGSGGGEGETGDSTSTTPEAPVTPGA